MSGPAQWIGRAEAWLRPYLENRRVLEGLRHLRKLLERHGADRLTVQFDGFRLTGGLAERTLLLGAAEGGRESFTLSLWAALTGPGVTALDVGAHIGIFALVAARGVGPGGRVWAIEPNPQAFHYLEHNLRANGIANVTALETAASDHSGQAVLSVPAGDRTQRPWWKWIRAVRSIRRSA
jgi:Met-10+ like-protein